MPREALSFDGPLQELADACKSLDSLLSQLFQSYEEGATQALLHQLWNDVYAARRKMNARIKEIECLATSVCPVGR